MRKKNCHPQKIFYFKTLQLISPKLNLLKNYIKNKLKI